MKKKSEPKKTTLRQLLDECKNNPKPKLTIEDTLDQKQIARLKPLAWLIEREQYTLEEVMTTGLAYHTQLSSRARRAEEILQLIKARKQFNGK